MRNTPRKSKYGAIKTECDGILFASKHEAKIYRDLQLLQRAKVISLLRTQPRYPLVVNGVKICIYIGDFEFQERGQLVCGDAKGFSTREYIIKRKLFIALYPKIEHREY